MGEKGGAALLGSKDQVVTLAGSKDQVVTLLGEFGVGFKAFSGTYVVDKDSKQIVDKDGKLVIL